jgi:hypothetical protein
MNGFVAGDGPDGTELNRGGKLDSEGLLAAVLGQVNVLSDKSNEPRADCSWFTEAEEVSGALSLTDLPGDRKGLVNDWKKLV